MTVRPFLALALALLFTTATQASELNFFQKLEVMNACGPDIEAACGNVESGNGRVAQCVRNNAHKLSQVCLDTLARVRADFLEGTDAAMDY
jgi:hypothetical protein